MAAAYKHICCSRQRWRPLLSSSAVLQAAAVLAASITGSVSPLAPYNRQWSRQEALSGEQVAAGVLFSPYKLV